MILCAALELRHAADQPDAELRRICERSYAPLLRILSAAPEARITLGIDGALLERLVASGAGDIVEGIAKAVFRGQIEIAGSADRNLILRGLPRAEIERAIDENATSLRRAFGDSLRPAGFFPPELGYDAAMGQAVRSRGYRWILVDEIAAGELELEMPQQRAYQLAGGEGLGVFFRNRGISGGLLFGAFDGVGSILEALGSAPDAPGHLVVAVPAEVFGHHHEGYESLLEEMLAGGALRTATLSGLQAELQGPAIPVELRSSTWSPWETLQY